jgi:perosamine synthetase
MANKEELSLVLSRKVREIPLMEVRDGNTVLFRPHVPRNASAYISSVLQTRWIGQGPQVDKFEIEFAKRFATTGNALAVGSGTDALHLAYLLAGIGPGDEVVTPVFTCTATNIPLLYIGAKPVFVDVDPESLNINIEHLNTIVSDRTKAIVVVHYAGMPCNMEAVHSIASRYGIPVIEDAAQALGATYKGRTIGEISDFTVFSFQAIKHISTGDGGILVVKDESKLDLAKRLRWFGIDRSQKQLGTWENDIREIGYKYQMTDIGAAMGLAGLEELDEVLDRRRSLLKIYESRLAKVPGLDILSHSALEPGHAAWLATVAVDERQGFQRKLWEHKIESNQVHYRNDRYSIFGQRLDLPFMNAVEQRYVCLPLHTHLTEEDVHHVCNVISSGW